MNIRRFLVGTACALLMATGAHATDAVVPDPWQSPDAQHVGACDAYGPGFTAVRGTGTCVKVSGQVRFEERFSSAPRTSRGRTTLDIETRSDPW